MDTTIADSPADSTTADDFSALVAVLEQPMRRTDDVHRRIRWLLDLASALDSLPFDGISELADEARSEATTLIKRRLASVAGRQP